MSVRNIFNLAAVKSNKPATDTESDEPAPKQVKTNN